MVDRAQRDAVLGRGSDIMKELNSHLKDMPFAVSEVDNL